jgi:hypothetical protein
VVPLRLQAGAANHRAGSRRRGRSFTNAVVKVLALAWDVQTDSVVECRRRGWSRRRSGSRRAPAVDFSFARGAVPSAARIASLHHAYRGDGALVAPSVGEGKSEPECGRGDQAAVVLAAADCSVDQQHELSAHGTRLADAVCLRDVGQRECLADREREPPGLDQVPDLGRRLDRAARVTSDEPHVVTLRAGKVGDRDDVLRIACEFDELVPDGAPGDIERQFDTIGSERRDWLRHAVTVGDGFGAEGAQEIVCGGTAAADHACDARHAELDGGPADASGRATD